MSLEIGNADKDGVVVLELKGSLDASSVDQLNKIIRDMSAQKGTYRLVLSMNALEFISSAGWSVLVETSKEMKDKNGVIKAQVMTALPMLVINICLMYFLAFPGK